MNQELDIDKLLDDEISKASRYFFPPEEQDKDVEKMKLTTEVADKVFSRIKGKSSAFFTLNGLLGLLATLDLEPFWANRIFDKIETKLKIEQRKSKLEEEHLDNYKMLLFETKLTAISYNKKTIHQELKNDDLPKKLKRINKTLLEMFSPEDTFKREALLEVKKEIENEIALNKEELLHRQQLQNPSKTVGEKENFIKQEGRNIESATLFFLYLFDFAKVSCPFTKKAEAIEFLTGFSKSQIIKLPSAFEKQKLEIEDGGEVDKKFSGDMQIVESYFQKLGLSEIVERIKKDLGD